MKKTTTCAFCGKELKTGILGQGVPAKNLPLEVSDLKCCPHCYQKYIDFVQQDSNRFSKKLENIFYHEEMIYDLERLLTPEEIAAYFVTYYEESKAYDLNRRFSGFFSQECEETGPISFTLLAEETEYLDTMTPIELTSYCTDIIRNENVFALNCAARGEVYTGNAPWPFRAEDISCLEYTFSDEEISEDAAFVKIMVKFNDSRQMTYKPCVLQGILLYPIELQDLPALIERRVAQEMENLRQQLGIDTFPLLRRKKKISATQDKCLLSKNPISPDSGNTPSLGRRNAFSMVLQRRSTHCGSSAPLLPCWVQSALPSCSVPIIFRWWAFSPL